jgi:DNA-directed RNA polymerase subunit alpha
MEALPLPNQAKITHEGGNKYSVVLEPLYPGYGVTLGNTLRRVLLSSMPGAAVTAVKIKFADHEFSTVPHIKEDVIQIILNLKQLRLRVHSQEPIKLELKVKGEQVVTAASFKGSDQVEIANPDLHLATIDNKLGELDMEVIAQAGRGYVPVEAREHEKLEIGMLGIDAIYTPIKSVYFDVTNVRVGQITNFDKLTITIETDGTIDGTEAINIASHILVDHFTMLFNDQNARLQTSVAAPEELGTETSVAAWTSPESVEEDEAPIMGGEHDLDSINLSNRAKNALIKNGIITLEKLKALRNEEIEVIPGLGQKTIAEIMMVLGR